jgi:hypothetical protein
MPLVHPIPGTTAHALLGDEATLVLNGSEDDAQHCTIYDPKHPGTEGRLVLREQVYELRHLAEARADDRHRR